MQNYQFTKAGAGTNDNIFEQVDPTHLSGRLSLRPDEHAGQGQPIGGHYNLACSYSNTAAKPAAGSDVFSLRWADSKMLFLLRRFSVWVVGTTAYTATLNQDLAIYRATGFSVAASAGTQVVPVAGSQQRARLGNMGQTLISGTSGLLWISSGDLLTVGTRTLDTQPFGYVAWQNTITTSAVPFLGILYEQRNGQHPILLGPNEGLVVQTPLGNTQAAGVSKYTFVMEYAEVPAY